MARTFDGLNYLTTASALVASAPMTFACWFNPTSHTADAYIMGIASATSTHSSVFAMKLLTASAKMCCYISNDAASTTDITAAATTALSNATWYHVACVFSSATSRTCYVNGGNSTTSAVSVTPGTCDSSYIGDVKFNAIVKTGAIGAIAFPSFWNIALTAADVLALSNSLGPIRNNASALKGYARLSGVSPETDMVSSAGWTLVSG